MLRSELCDFSDAYIVDKGTITVTNPDNNAYDKKLAFENNAAFVSCISRNNFIQEIAFVSYRQCWRFRYYNAYVQLAWIQ